MSYYGKRSGGSKKVNNQCLDVMNVTTKGPNRICKKLLCGAPVSYLSYSGQNTHTM
jgi:hypothetical protein